jgi:predicted negative regulator of RcsB-dependent stress response
MKDRFGSTAYAQQAGLLMAKQYADANKLDNARSALTWVAEHSSDDGYQAVARLRLSAILAEGKNYEGALAQLAGSFPDSFQALVADRRADVLLLQGKKPQAVTEYQKAYRLLDASNEYRRLVEAKLNTLGVDAQAPEAVTVAK